MCTETLPWTDVAPKPQTEAAPAAPPLTPVETDGETPRVDQVVGRARRHNARDLATAIAFTLLLGATILALL
jgi:hypothetical protein